MIKDEKNVNQVWGNHKNLVKRDVRRTHMIYDILRAFVDSSSKILELGPGRGYLTQYLVEHNHKVTSVERSEIFFSSLIKEKKLSSVRLINQEAIDYLSHNKSNQFNAIVGIGILHHIWDHPHWAYLLQKNLIPNGIIVFLEPNPLNPLARIIFSTPIGRKIFSLDPKENLKSIFNIKQELNLYFKNIKITQEDLFYPITLNIPLSLISELELKLPLFIKKYLAQSIMIQAIKK